MSTLLIDLRLALRALQRSPTFATAVILTLALGIGVTSGVFSVLTALLWRPLPFAQPDRLVHVWATDKRDGWDRLEVTPLDYSDWRNSSRTFDRLAAFRMAELHEGERLTTERVQVAYVSAGVFELLGVAPLLGRTLTVEEEQRGDAVAVVSAGWWNARHGGDRGALERPVILNGKPHTIVGVMAETFAFPIPTTDIWLPLSLRPEENNRRAGMLRVVGRLGPEATAQSAQQELDAINATLARSYPDTNADRGARVVPLRQGLMFAYDRVAALSRVLLGACAFVLLLVYANVGNLMAARLIAAQRQIAICCALGASRLMQMRPVMLEAIVLVAAGGVLGLVFASWLGQALAAAIPENIYRVGSFGVSGETIVLAFALCVCSAIVIAVAQLSRVRLAHLVDTLRERTAASHGRRARARFNVLATAQIAVATILLASALLMGRSLQALNKLDAGFEPDQVLTLEFSLPTPAYDSRDAIARFVRDVRERASAAPGVSALAVVNFLPLNHEHRWREFLVAGVDDAAKPPEGAIELVVTDGYFRTMGIPIVAGRDFLASDDTTAPAVAIVNETFVRQRLAGRNPLGARVAVPSQKEALKPLTIVGVVGDTKHVDLAAPPPPMVFVPFYQEPWVYFRFVARTTGEPYDALPGLKTALAAADPHVAASRIRTLREVMAASLLPQRVITATLAGLAAGALLLVVVGLYGVVAYAVSMRSREFAVRVALGAGRTSVLRMVLLHAIKLAAIGLGIGVAATLIVGQGLNRFLYGIRVQDGTTVAAVVAVVASVALLASYLPARRASRVSPADTLRYE